MDVAMGVCRKGSSGDVGIMVWTYAVVSSGR